MKKIINKKVYNTDTARYIAFWSNDLPTSDFAWTEERLFQKRTGEYFLFGESGPMGKYASCNDDNSIGYGKEIIPMTDDKAKKWLSKRGLVPARLI